MIANKHIPNTRGPQVLLCVLRPNRTTLWLRRETANRVGLSRGQILTEEQLRSPLVQEDIQTRVIHGRRAA